MNEHLETFLLPHLLIYSSNPVNVYVAKQELAQVEFVLRLTAAALSVGTRHCLC